METYFEMGSLDEDELREGLKIGMMKHDVFPVFCLSTRRNMGSGRLMGFIDNVAPSASDMPADLAGGKEVLCDPAGAAWLLTFRSEEHKSELQSLTRLSYA